MSSSGAATAPRRTRACRRGPRSTVGADALTGAAPAAGARLEGERLRGDVVDARGERRVEGGRPVRLRLSRAAVDEVERDVREAGGPGRPRGGDGAAGRVAAVEGGEDVRRGALHA